MEFLIQIFNLILYQPLLNGLILLYQYLPGHDFGIAIIVLTVLIRIIFYPLGAMAIKSQKILAELQPKIKEIQKKYQNDKEKQFKAIIEFYQKEKINPFSSFLPFLIQLPVLIALYQVFWKGLSSQEMNYLYSFVSVPSSINYNFLGIFNLTENNLGIAVLAGLSQFFQTKMFMPKEQKEADRFSKIIQKQMLYFFPIFTVFVLYKLPAAIGLYWIVTTLFSIIQQYFILKHYV